jgi:hypothetical protein
VLLVASLPLVSGPTSKPGTSALTRHFDSDSWDQLLEGDEHVFCGDGNGVLIRLRPDGADSVDPALNLQDNDQLYLLDYDANEGSGTERAAVWRACFGDTKNQYAASGVAIEKKYTWLIERSTLLLLMTLPGKKPVVFYRADERGTGGLTSKGHQPCGADLCMTSEAYPSDKEFARKLKLEPYSVRGAFAMKHLRVGLYLHHVVFLLHDLQHTAGTDAALGCAHSAAPPVLAQVRVHTHALVLLTPCLP